MCKNKNALLQVTHVKTCHNFQKHGFSKCTHMTHCNCHLDTCEVASGNSHVFTQFYTRKICIGAYKVGWNKSVAYIL